jgi:hypothetical protein
MKIQYLGMPSFAMKYPEKRKKEPIRPAIKDVPMMKFGTRTLKHATKELAIKTTIHTTTEK